MSNYKIINICLLFVTSILVACSPNNSDSTLNSNSASPTNSNNQPIAQPAQYHAYIDPVTGKFISSPAKSTESKLTTSNQD